MPAVAAAANSSPEDTNEAYRTSASIGPNGINHLLIINPLHKSPDIIRAGDPVGVVGRAEPKNIKYLLQSFRETRRFNPLNLIRLYSYFVSLMTRSYAQPASRFIRRLRRPGIHHAGWVAVYR